MSSKQRIHRAPEVLVLTTGGTLDKSYNFVTERFSFDEPSILAKLVADSFLSEVRVKPVIQIDSLDMTTEHRALIISEIEGSKVDRIVIIHGTSTMIQTGERISQEFHTEKTIVLTGALKPARYDVTEAAINFGAAICAARYMPGGVYISMHGLVEVPSKLHKDSDTGRFEIFHDS